MNDHHLNLKKSMQLWSETLGYEIDEGVCYLKDTMDDLVKLQMVPGECVANLNAAEKGVSITACVPQTLVKIDKVQFEEKACQNSTTLWLRLKS